MDISFTGVRPYSQPSLSVGLIDAINIGWSRRRSQVGTSSIVVVVVIFVVIAIVKLAFVHEVVVIVVIIIGVLPRNSCAPL